MKKSILTIAALFCCMALSATTYTSHLQVAINNEAAEQEEVPVVVVEENGSYTLSLKNFVLKQEGFDLPVGNIEVTGVVGVDEYGYTTIKFYGPVSITAGDDPAYDQDAWLGPMLDDVPIDLTARFTKTALSANIAIDLVDMMGQTINVNLFGVAPTLKGDVNEDNEVNISDVSSVIDIILGH